MHKLLITSGGSTICGPDSMLRVRLPDKSYVDIRASEAHRYTDTGATTFFEKKYLDLDRDQLEERLLQAQSGPHACFRVSKGQLFDANGETVLSSTLNGYRQGQQKKMFADMVHEYLERGAVDPQLRQYLSGKGFDGNQVSQLMSGKVIRPVSVVCWFNGTIAPDNWRDFYSLSLMSETFKPAEIFGKFFDDFIDYKLWQEKALAGNEEPSPNVADNKYAAYLTYCGCRLICGMRARTINPSSRRRKAVSGPRKITGTADDLEAIKAYLKNEFCRDVTEEISEVALLAVKDISVGKKKKSKGNSGGKMRKGVVFITPQTSEEIPVLAKSLYDICKDVIILERTIISHARDYMISENESKLEGKMEYVYAMKMMEKKVRIDYPPYDLSRLGVSHGRQREIEELVAQSHAKLFAENPEDTETQAFQNLFTAYQLIHPAWPREFVEMHNLTVEMTNLDMRLEDKGLKRRDRRKAEKEKAKFFRKFSELQQEKGWGELFTRVTKELPSEKMEVSSADIDAKRFTSLNPAQMLENMELEPCFESVQLVSQEFYSVHNIQDVLRRHGGEALIAENTDIFMLEKIFSFMPGVDYGITDRLFGKPDRFDEFGRRLF
ncbi:hypothetical protein ACFLZB_03435 [Nanoarchaeota archaeon]